MKEREPRVFVVDDDQSVRTSLANLLETADYAVQIFASAAEYLACVPYPGPACLVLDVQLPGLEGRHPPTPTHRGRQDGADRLYHRARRYSNGYWGNETRRGRFFAKTVLGTTNYSPLWRRRWRALARIASNTARWLKAARGLRSSRHENSRSSG
jgi:hypothetical protein